MSTNENDGVIFLKYLLLFVAFMATLVTTVEALSIVEKRHSTAAKYRMKYISTVEVELIRAE